MNLIEQFGYEAVKAELKDKKWRRDNLHGSAEFTWHMEQHIQLLEAILLQHRRQHNIFEVGDAVIRKWNGRLYYLIVDIDNDGQEFLIHHDKGAKFKDCRIFDNICNFKHATDVEIKAGKRLEVNQ